MKDNITELQARPQSDSDFMNAANEMRGGGSFAYYLATAYYMADSHNKERLKAAFPDLFTRYYNQYLQTLNERN